MVRLAAWLVGDSALAEDIVQDAFVRLNTTSADLNDLDSGPAYLRVTVVNLCRSRHKREALARRLRTQDRPARSAPGPEAFLLDEDLVAAVASLSRRQRECVVLRYSEDLSVDQIAAAIVVGSAKAYVGGPAAIRITKTVSSREQYG